MKKHLGKTVLNYDEFLFLLRLRISGADNGSAYGLLIDNAHEVASYDGAKRQEIYDAVFKKNYLYSKEDGLHFSREIHNLLTSIIKSPEYLVIKKPSYEKNGRQITLYSYNGTDLCLEQDLKANKVTIYRFLDTASVYAHLESELMKKDCSKFKKKQFDEIASKIGPEISFGSKPENIISITTGTNDGSKLKSSCIYVTGKDDAIKFFDLHSDAPSKLAIKPLLVPSDIKSELERIHTKKSDDDNDTDFAGHGEENEPLSFENLVKSDKFPTNPFKFIFWIVKNIFVGFWQHKLRFLLMLLVDLIAAGLVLVWNMYGTCYLNDTFNFARNLRYGELMPYLFGGAMAGRYIRGIKTYMDNSALLAGFFYASLFFVLRMVGERIVSKKLGVFKELFGGRKLYKRYISFQARTIKFYYCWGLIFAGIAAIFIANPLTILVLGIAFLLSFLAGSESGLAGLLMVANSSFMYRRVMKGKSEPPLFSAIKLHILGAGLGFVSFAFLDLIIWKVFKYAFAARIVFSVIVILAAFILSGLNSKRAQAVAKILIITAISAIIIKAFGPDLIAFADDGGWSESGRTLKGLFANAGFGAILGISAAVALCCIAVPFTAAVAYGAMVGIGTFALASTNEYVGRSADAFIYGKYSDSDPTLLSIGASIVVGMVPGVGDLWSIAAGTRDLTVDVKNGDVVGMAFDIFSIGMGVKGIQNGSLERMSEAISNSKALDAAARVKPVDAEVIGNISSGSDDLINSSDDLIKSTDDLTGSIDDAGSFVSPGKADDVLNSADNVVNSADNVEVLDDLDIFEQSEQIHPFDTDVVPNDNIEVLTYDYDEAVEVLDTSDLNISASNKTKFTDISQVNSYQTEAISTYSGSSYDNINAHLLNRGQASPENIARIEVMQETLSNSSLPNSVTVYRGTSINELGDEFAEVIQYSPESLVGQTYTQPAFMSTSLSEDVARNKFATNMLVTIEAPQGAQGLSIASISQHPDEMEVLFNSGREMTITRVVEEDGFWHVFARMNVE